MRSLLLSSLVAAFVAPALVSCVDQTKEPVRKAVPPPRNHDSKPWNSEGPSGGGAAFGALPQNKYRR